ncbi:hypothetical protein KJ359_012797 [Pestalotiopsis sp. 9143b]|nr:hypothetical protein KJ359_012797 [Pestalotiopsis sp. 9143b]
MGLLKDTASSVLGNTADVLDDTAKAIEGDKVPQPSTAVPASSTAATMADTTTSTTGGETAASSTSSGYRETETLSALRLLIGGSTDRKEFVLLNFCSKKGAIVPDNYAIKDYLQQCLEDEKPSEGTINLYLQKVFETKTQLDEGRLSDVVNVSRLAELKRKFDDTGFKLLTGTYWKYPAELEEKEWAAIAENNSLCYGLRVVRRKENGVTVVAGIERARYPAFRLKQRDIVSDRLASSTARDVVLYLRIPDYIVDDKSYVSIYETESALQSSLATSSFSEFDVSASGEKQVTIAYNFPRVTVFLDNRSLELTKNAQADLDKIRDKEGLEAFLDDYGELFAPRVQLGGRLFASESVSTSSSESTTQIKNSMRAAASVSFSGFGASASVSTSGQSGSASSTGSSTTDSKVALTWQANGGDSLLCNKKTFRVVCNRCGLQPVENHKDEGLHLVDFVGKFRGYETFPERMTEWKKTEIPAASSKIYLNGAQAYPDGRYLTADPLKRRGDDVILAYNAEGGHEMSYESFPYFGRIRISFLGPIKARREVKFFEWEVEDEDGHPVTTMCYETPYRLKSPENGYLSFYGPFVNVIDNKGAMVRFVSTDGKNKNGAIADGALLNLYMYNFGMPKTPENSCFVFVCSKDKENEYLSVSDSSFNLMDEDDQPLLLVYRTAK